MMISVSGNSASMDLAKTLYPDYMDRLSDNTDAGLIQQLNDLGLSVTINEVTYDANESEYCKVEFDDDDFDDAAEDWP
jgi:hypothetical protein